MATLLNAETVARLLDEVPNWRLAAEAIERTVKCKDFMAAISFVNQVAAEAEAMNHHPDIDIRWNKVRLVLTTHSAQGLTDLDFTLARKLDAVAEPFTHTAATAH
jgi:4a-hydroxytetrahydrobiopterin dehydratase